MRNLLTQLLEVLGDPILQIGTVTSVSAGKVVVQLPGGGVLSARGAASVGTTVYVRDGVVEGVAPSLPVSTIEI